MKNQFFYTIEQKIPKQVEEGKEPEYEIVKLLGSFNIDKVIRSIEVGEGSLRILLDDFHLGDWAPVRMAKFSAKGEHNGGYSIEYKQTTQCSEIDLNKEDSIRFRKITEF